MCSPHWHGEVRSHCLTVINIYDMDTYVYIYIYIQNIRIVNHWKRWSCPVPESPPLVFFYLVLPFMTVAGWHSLIAETTICSMIEHWSSKTIEYSVSTLWGCRIENLLPDLCTLSSDMISLNLRIFPILCYLDSVVSGRSLSYHAIFYRTSLSFLISNQ